MKKQLALKKTADELIVHTFELGRKCKEKKRIIEQLNRLFTEYVKLSKQPQNRILDIPYQKKLKIFLNKLKMPFNIF